MNILIKNIKSLVQVEQMPVKWVAGKNMSKLSTIEDAWLYIKNGLRSEEHTSELQSLE